MNTVLVTGPEELPVSLAEVKNFLKGYDDITVDDALMVALLRSAIESAETYQNRKFITQTWDLKLDAFPACGPLYFPYGRLQSVTSVTYVDSNGETQTWASSNYELDTSGVLGLLQPAYGIVYPATRSVLNAVTIRFVCGYGPTPGSVPEGTRTAILMQVREWYDKRGDGQNLEVVERLLAPQRIEGFA